MIDRALSDELRRYVARRGQVSDMVRSVCADHAVGRVAATPQQAAQLRGVLDRLVDSERRMWANYADRRAEAPPPPADRTVLELLDELERAGHANDALEQMRLADACGVRLVRALERGASIAPAQLDEIVDLILAVRASANRSIVAFLSSPPPPRRR